jgi:hypothetical protein
MKPLHGFLTDEVMPVLGDFLKDLNAIGPEAKDLHAKVSKVSKSLNELLPDLKKKDLYDDAALRDQLIGAFKDIKLVVIKLEIKGPEIAALNKFTGKFNDEFYRHLGKKIGEEVKETMATKNRFVRLAVRPLIVRQGIKRLMGCAEASGEDYGKLTKDIFNKSLFTPICEKVQQAKVSRVNLQR